MRTRSINWEKKKKERTMSPNPISKSRGAAFGSGGGKKGHRNATVPTMGPKSEKKGACYHSQK